MSDRTSYLGTGIADLGAAKRYLRRKFNQGPAEPVVSRPGARFYVTARSGRRTVYLLGPYASHMTALVNVDRGRILAHTRGAAAAFACYGTASALQTLPARFGR